MSTLIYTILGLTSIISLILIITGIRKDEEGYVIGGCIMFMIVLFGIGLGSLGPCQSSLDNETIITINEPSQNQDYECVGKNVMCGMDVNQAIQICLLAVT